MFEVILSPGSEGLSVKLTLNLSDYCRAARAHRDAGDKKTPSEERIYTELRTELEDNFTRYKGLSHWPNIKSLLSLQCNKKEPSEARLADVLDPDSGTEGPHVITSLDTGFIELFKNSTDAVIRQYITGASENMTLEMTIALKVKARDISVSISDNAGGFPSELIESFKSPKEVRGRRDSAPGEKKGDSKYLLGGAGLGLQQLCDMVECGEVCSGGIVYQYHSVPADSTAMDIRNTDGGAEVTLFSPLAPLLRHTKVKSVAALDGDDEEATVLLPIHSARRRRGSDDDDNASPGAFSLTAPPAVAKEGETVTGGAGASPATLSTRSSSRGSEEKDDSDSDESSTDHRPPGM